MHSRQVSVSEMLVYREVSFTLSLKCLPRTLARRFRMNNIIIIDSIVIIVVIIETEQVENGSFSEPNGESIST